METTFDEGRIEPDMMSEIELHEYNEADPSVNFMTSGVSVHHTQNRDTDSDSSTRNSSGGSLSCDSSRPTSIGSEDGIPDEKDDPTDDIVSLITIKDDGASVFDPSPATASQRQAAVAYLVDTFLQDEELLSLYKLASSKLDQARFIRNHRKLLSFFVRDLRVQGASGPSQYSAISFLNGYHTRVAISSSILEKLAESTEPDTAEQLAAEKKEDPRSLINRYLSRLPPINVDQQEQQQLSVPHGPESDSDSDQASDVDGQNSEEVYRNTFALLEETREFLCTGQAFQLYKKNLHCLLHPGSESSTPLDQETINPESQSKDEPQEPGSCAPTIDNLSPGRTAVFSRWLRWLAILFGGGHCAQLDFCAVDPSTATSSDQNHWSEVSRLFLPTHRGVHHRLLQIVVGVSCWLQTCLVAIATAREATSERVHTDLLNARKTVTSLLR